MFARGQVGTNAAGSGRPAPAARVRAAHPAVVCPNPFLQPLTDTSGGESGEQRRQGGRGYRCTGWFEWRSGWRGGVPSQVPLRWRRVRVVGLHGREPRAHHAAAPAPRAVPCRLAPGPADGQHRVDVHGAWQAYARAPRCRCELAASQVRLPPEHDDDRHAYVLGAQPRRQVPAAAHARLLRSPAACLHGMRCVLHGVGCPVGRGGDAPCVSGLFVCVCVVFVCTPTAYSEYSQH